MGQLQSKDNLLYKQAIDGNVDNIKALHREGAGLEWVDKDGKTALIVASMDPKLYLVAQTLIQMGANVNAYCLGRQAGTPLHHAAKRGLDQTVSLLLSHGANAFSRNDDVQTPLDVSRAAGHNNVVRAIEGHTCYYSGNVREILVPRIIEKLAPQFLSRKCWAVVVPCSPSHPTAPPMLELAVYLTEQDAKPLAVIPLWKSIIEDPDFHQEDPVLIIFDKSSKRRYKFASATVGDKSQIQSLHKACKGIPQVIRPPIPSSVPAAPVSGSAEAQVQQPNSSTNDNEWMPEPINPNHNTVILQGTESAPCRSNPSAPSVPYDDGVIHYPTIDMTPGEVSVSVSVSVPNTQNEANENNCVICWEAPVEGVCIPCGHMAGCMSCLNTIKASKGDCPVCRAHINQVVRLYAV